MEVLKPIVFYGGFEAQGILGGFETHGILWGF